MQYTPRAMGDVAQFSNVLTWSKYYGCHFENRLEENKIKNMEKAVGDI